MDRRSKNESSEDRLSTSSVRREGAKPIKIDGHGTTRIFSVAFLADGKHIVSGSNEEKIRRWRVEDGKEVGTPMNAGSNVFDIAATPDGKWIVSGTESGRVTVWNADSHEKVIEFQAHSDCVWAVDVSPDGTRIASGSRDDTASVWSLSTGQRLLGPWGHDDNVVAVKFSPDGRLIATATWYHKSVRIYDSQDGHLLFDLPIQVNSYYNQSLAWASDSKQLFALSEDGEINCLDVTTRKTLSKWLIHSSEDPNCIALASNGTFIAASGGSSVSFWDATTHNQIGSVIEHVATVAPMAVSVNHDIVIGGDSKVTRLEKTIRELGDELATFQRTAEEENDRVNKTITSLCADLRREDESSNIQITHLEKTVQDLRDELAMSQRTASQKEDSLNKIFDSLEKTVQQMMVAQRRRTAGS